MPDLRRATLSDAEAIRDLTRAAYTKWVALIGREPKPMTANYTLAVQNHLIDLLWDGGELAGLIETIPQPDHLLIENVAVAPAFQGRGHGGRLMAHAEHLAASLGLRQMKLYTNVLFAENVRLYRKLGYQVEREETFRGGVVVHMRKAV
jgi:ribosomal protein S18 acetylase RimI-like enzyme